MPVQTLLQHRRSSAAVWAAANPVLAASELGFDTDAWRFKIGDGVTAWNSLPFQGLVGPTGPTGPAGPTGAASNVTGPTGATGASAETITAINNQSGTSYTPVLADKDKLVILTNASPISFTVPTNTSVAFPIGSVVNIVQGGLGTVTVSAASPLTTTINTTPGYKLRANWSQATLIKIAIDTWILSGDTVL
jgi:hypothetical protein